MKTFVVALSVLAFSTAAMAENSQTRNERTSTERQQTGAQEPDEKSERMICRRVGDGATGSHLGQRRCLTAEQWRALRR